MEEARQDKSVMKELPIGSEKSIEVCGTCLYFHADGIPGNSYKCTHSMTRFHTQNGPTDWTAPGLRSCGEYKCKVKK